MAWGAYMAFSWSKVVSEDKTKQTNKRKSEADTHEPSSDFWANSFRGLDFASWACSCRDCRRSSVTICGLAILPLYIYSLTCVVWQCPETPWTERIIVKSLFVHCHAHIHIFFHRSTLHLITVCHAVIKVQTTFSNSGDVEVTSHFQSTPAVVKGYVMTESHLQFSLNSMLLLSFY